MPTFVKPTVGQGARTLDARWYILPRSIRAGTRAHHRARLDLRRTKERLEHSGDYFLATIAGESLIISRDADAVRAFHNVCRHRGRGSAKKNRHFSGSMQCPYHAWTYGLDGALKGGAQHADGPGFERADYPLTRRRRASGKALSSSTSAQPHAFEHAFAPVLERFAQWNIGELRAAGRIDYDLACNWKLIFQNYSECYHCPLVHPQLDKLSPSDSGRNDFAEGPILGRLLGTALANGGSLTTRPTARRRSATSPATTSTASTTTRSFRRCC